MTPPTSSTPAQIDPFRYGWRYVPVTRPDGATELEQVPLTLEDVLHPQAGDVIPEARYHEAERRYLSDVLNACEIGPPVALVTSDLIIDWGVEASATTHPTSASSPVSAKARAPRLARFT